MRSLGLFISVLILTFLAACGGDNPGASQRHALSVTFAGDGSGTVRSTPAGIDDCTETCSAEFSAGAQVALTATPASGSSFAGWGGACTGTGPCTVTMDGAKAVTATFAQGEQPSGVSWRAEPGSLSFRGDLGGPAPEAQSLELHNDGSEAGSYTISENLEWLDVTPSSGTVEAGGSGTLTITVAACSSAGTESGTVTVSGGGSSAELAVSRSCIDPANPWTLDFRGGTFNIDESYFGLSSLSSSHHGHHQRLSDLLPPGVVMLDDLEPQATAAVRSFYYLSVSNGGGGPSSDTRITIAGPEGSGSAIYPAETSWLVARSRSYGSGGYTATAEVDGSPVANTANIDLSNVLPVPTGITMNHVSTSTVEVSWNPVPGAVMYSVRVDGQLEGPLSTQFVDTAQATMTDLRLSSSRSYVLYVFAYTFNASADSDQPYPGPLPAAFNASVAVVEFGVGGTFKISEPNPNPLMLTARVGERVSGTFNFENLGTADYRYGTYSGMRWLRVSSGGSGTVPVGQSQTVTVEATCPSTPGVLHTGVEIRSMQLADSSKGQISVNLTCTGTDDVLPPVVGGFYVTQAAQNLAGSVPLVAGREGLARAFVVASQPVAVSGARLHALRSGTPLGSLDLSGPGQLPAVVNEGDLASSFNVRLPGTWIQPGLELYIEVDTAQGQVRYPESGTLSMDVRQLLPLDIKFVPITYVGVTPEVEGKEDAYLDATMRMFPIPSAITSTRQPYTFDGLLNEVAGWLELAEELQKLRLMEVENGSLQYYHGIVDEGFPAAAGGVGLPGVLSAISHSRLPSASEIVAHELGHNWNREHVDCGYPGGPTRRYPYLNASIGTWGYDLVTGELKDPSVYKDIMSYCDPQWTSDYTYTAVLEYREKEAAAAAAQTLSSEKEPVLLISGRVSQGQVTLEPAFQFVGWAHPPASGPYVLQGLDAQGGRLFEVPFETYAIAHMEDVEVFAFTLPLSESDAANLASLRVVGEAGQLLAEASSQLQAQQLTPAAVRAQRLPDGNVEVSWDAALYPSVIIRDGVDGAVLTIARGGTATVQPSGRVLELLLSDGVQSRSQVVSY